MLGQEDLDRAVLVDRHNVVRRVAVDVAHVHLGKVPATNLDAVRVVKARSRRLVGVDVVAGC